MRFIKEILRPASYLARGLDGTRKLMTITEKDLEDTAETFRQMRAEKFKFPAPFKHGEPNKDMLGPVIETRVNEIPSNENGGWWENLWYDHAKQTLYGEVDVPLEEHAKLIGKTICDVSPVIKDFTDGSNKTWKKAPYHIALVNHPVMHGQENFQPLAASLDSSVGFALSLADITEVPEVQILTSGETEVKSGKEEGAAMATDQIVTTSPGDSNATGTGVKDVLGLLKKLNIALPEDTTPENFMERLAIALKALSHVEGKNDPEQQVEQPLPVAMSLGDQTVAETTVNTTPVPNPYKVIAEEQFRQSYIGRVESLVSTGRLAPAAASRIFKPKLEGFAMDLGDDGKPIESPVFTVEEVLQAFESIPPNTILNVSGAGKTGKDKKGIAFSFEEPLPEGYEGQDPNNVTEEQADKLVREQLERSGVIESKN